MAAAPSTPSKRLMPDTDVVLRLPDERDEKNERARVLLEKIKTKTAHTKAQLKSRAKPKDSNRQAQKQILWQQQFLAQSLNSRCGRSGHLMKQGTINRAWKERWFVLPGHGPLLLWYDSGTDVVPKAVVECVSVSNVTSEGGKHVFEVWATLAKGVDASMTGGDGAAAKVNSMMRRIGSASSRKREEGVPTSRKSGESARKSGEDRDEEAPPAFGRIQMPMPKPADAEAAPASPRGRFTQSKYKLAAPTLEEAESWVKDIRESIRIQMLAGIQGTSIRSASSMVDASKSRLNSLSRMASFEHRGEFADEETAAAAAAADAMAMKRLSTLASTLALIPEEGETPRGEPTATATERPRSPTPMEKKAIADKQLVLNKRALFLCRQAELSEGLADELAGIATDSPEAMTWTDERGIMPAHWICGSPAVTTSLICAVFDAAPEAASVRDKRGILPLHWLAANANATAEMLLVVLEAFEEAAEARDNYGQLPLHWLAGSASEDMRSYELLVGANPDGLLVADRHGMMPMHWLCHNAFAQPSALRMLLEAEPECASKPDAHGQLPIHILCNNEAVDAELLELILQPFPEAAAMPDSDGLLPLHFLAKTQPDAVELWQMLIAAAESSAAKGGGGGSGGGSSAKGVRDLAALRALMPVLLGETGEVTGVKGRVKGVVAGAAAAARNVRPEDKGALLFTSSMSAVKQTREGCKHVTALLDALMVKYEARDVFVDLAYANQLRRLANCGGGKAPLPQLPQLYVDGERIGGREEIEDLNEAGELKAKVEAYVINMRGVEADERDCAVCMGKRFVICTECGGTRKGRATAFGSTMKCSNCNENGLMACPECNAADAKHRQETRNGLRGVVLPP